MKTQLLLLLGVLINNPVIVMAQDISGTELLEKSIQYHDPEEEWAKLRMTYMFSESRPDGSIRKTKVKINNKRNRFQLFQQRDSIHIYREIGKGNCTQKLNGSDTFSKELAEKYHLNCDYTKMIHGYYIYLWGLPSKLKDTGTIVHEKVETEDFQGMQAFKLKVTYADAVGKDTWYFYFDITSYALIGYRFYHDESKNDGEYIMLEDEVVFKGLRIPKTRKWYYNKDDKYLGTDVLDYAMGW